ncbi:hypothetical protein HYALB_00012167 [Hymenoscyphus albidus]|uniref:Uncharacterized protein n=1 Tax=Hymenoscyphus albidus TaxID=595503 RepID=A0A9N9Q7R8_9HELO|nr:hypothetical protein HYALB_00012167 [Hymenoscyphus albidus]
MLGQHFLSLGLFLSSFHQVLALTLKPLASDHFVDNHGVAKRNRNGTHHIDHNHLDLQDYESFYWGGHGGDSLIYANLTVFFNEEYEFVIGMEKFDGMLNSVDCSENMMLEFKDNATFTYAKQAWNWVSDDVNNTFVMVANYDGCGDDQERQPYLINDIHFDPNTYKVYLEADQKEWEEVAKTYTFNMGYKPIMNSTVALAKRDDPDFTMSLASHFNKNLFATKVSGVDLSVDCVDCGIVGRMLVDFDLEVHLLHAPKATMKVSPQDVVATMQLALTASGTLAKEYSWDKNLVSIPIEGIKVGKFAKIGAFLDVDVGFKMNEWTGEVRADFGAKASLSNSAVVKINALDPKNGEFSGWEPKLSALPLTMSAKVDGGVEIYAQPSITLSAEAFGKGLEMGLDLKMPYIQGDFSAMAISSGVCNTKKTIGVTVDAKAGVDLTVQVATAGNKANPLWEKSLFEKSWPLFNKCFPFGPDNAQSGVSQPPLPPKAPNTKVPLPKTQKPPKTRPTEEAPAKTLKPNPTKGQDPKTTKTTDDGKKPTSKPALTKSTKASDDDTHPTVKPNSSKPTAASTKVSSKDGESTPTSGKPNSTSVTSKDDESKPTSKAQSTKSTKSSDDDITSTVKPGSPTSKPASGTSKASSKDLDITTSGKAHPTTSSFSTIFTSKPSTNQTSKTTSRSKNPVTLPPFTHPTGVAGNVTSQTTSTSALSLSTSLPNQLPTIHQSENGTKHPATIPTHAASSNAGHANLPVPSGSAGNSTCTSSKTGAMTTRIGTGTTKIVGTSTSVSTSTAKSGGKYE